MDFEKFANSLDPSSRAKLEALGNTDAAKALDGMFSEAELIKAAGRPRRAGAERHPPPCAVHERGEKAGRMPRARP